MYRLALRGQEVGVLADDINLCPQQGTIVLYVREMHNLSIMFSGGELVLGDVVQDNTLVANLIID